MKPLQLWGGLECSVVRLQDGYRDQLRETGHETRPGDLEAIAALGIRTLRYPFLWERICPKRPDMQDWGWQDARAAELRRLDITPIAGLLHHGSGPRYTSLADPEMPRLFAAFAGRVAARYDWIRDWTPVNEPLTTARFSGLYGFWYPHGTSEKLFWHLLLNQIEATIRAMAAVRAVRSDARLIQSEDLARILATPDMEAEAAFQNHRRWLTWDLLAGKVTKDHPLWPRIARHGLGERLRALAGNPCPPDMLGVNHYLTSNRFLDGREAPGREHRDIEAIRIHAAPPTLEALLRESWERYRLPIAMTEVHNGCTREEQMRWFSQAWNAALTLRDEGADIRAVTSWALMGCMDWASLLMRREGIYEPGAFDIRGGKARPAALGRLLAGLATESPPAAPVDHLVKGPGWWNRPVRFTFPPYGPHAAEKELSPPGSPVLVIGRGRLGLALEAACRLRGLGVRVVQRPVVDVTSSCDIENAIAACRPWAVINACAITSMARAERQPELCFATNSAGAASVAAICARHDIPCVTCSSHLVFSGRGRAAYCEDDAPDPGNIYGKSKLKAEELVERRGGRQLIIRSAAFFGRGGLATRLASQLSQGRPVCVPDSHTFTPSYLPDVANAILDLLIDGESGIWHLSNAEAVSWAGFAAKLASALGVETSRIRTHAVRSGECRNTALGSQRGRMLPSLDNAVMRFAADFTAGPGPHACAKPGTGP
jgi:dTDP-4-dehydrorhamnose reductase